MQTRKRKRDASDKIDEASLMRPQHAPRHRGCRQKLAELAELDTEDLTWLGETGFSPTGARLCPT
ncbi:uncharacterized protein ColSpa_02515 [Colletotrichum spaethianum]|uniref:Uncharacterized protein n=1 Tax=Colletotrichum spaethianum TaxID=700344 RepID=A0AA37P768_9PEZI|nr:uncharacterized protein ColSpa_02515 [Colletotrichum spaethianum]GKT42334.1 hypothetical protein ColSpa_02515 [Colletotrichum spaethianum]